MSTNIFQQEVGAFLKANFIIAERLDDAYKNKFGGFQVSKKPYDFFGATKNGIFFGAEAKKIQTVRFPFINLYSHQRDALDLLGKNKCHGFLFINWRYKQAGEAIWIEYKNYKRIENKVKKLGRKSIKPTDFNKHWFLERISGGWVVPKGHRLKNIL